MKRIMIDASKCMGCKNCYAGCILAHGKDGAKDIESINMIDPANESRNTIKMDSDGNYAPIFCRHCDDSQCVVACISGALSKDAVTGHIRYDSDRCCSCFMCVMNCPYGIPKPDRTTGTSVVRCDFCLNDNEEPNCVKMCLSKAIYIEEADS